MKELYLHELEDDKSYRWNGSTYKVMDMMLLLKIADDWAPAVAKVDMTFTEIHEPITFAYIKDNCKIGITKFKVNGLCCDFVGWHRGSIMIYMGRSFDLYEENKIKEWEIR